MALWKIEHTGRKFVLTESSPTLDWLGVLAIAAAPGLMLLISIPVPLVLPIYSIVCFVAACGLALLAVSPYVDQRAHSPVIWDIVYAFTSIWLVTGMLSGPRALVQWLEQLSMTP